MHDERSAGTLTDAALDAEIARALKVDPSPQFVARVRAQLAEESQRPARFPTWTWAAAAVTAGAIVVAAVATVLVRSTNQLANTQTLSARSEIRMLPLPSDRSSSRRIEPRIATLADGRRHAVRASSEPEVLILERDRTALYALVRVVSGRRVTSTFVADGAPPSVTLDSAENVITPLVIEPLALTAGEQGARQ